MSSTPLRFGIISLFPDMFAALNLGITGRAQQQELMRLNFWNPRDFTKDKHRTVDDRPYGGGPGMLMLSEPLAQAIDAARETLPRHRVIALSPQGRPLKQRMLEQTRDVGGCILIAGRYEGIDERVIDENVDEEWSLGDFVMSGGEVAAMAIIDGTTRLIPGALGHECSAAEDSFMNGLLDCPHYTRPEEWRGHKVPDVLLSGDHRAIARWRLKQALGRTHLRRPDLLASRRLTELETTLLNEFLQEQKNEQHN